jgi:uncharacterized protein YdgA (DUF945 family)
MKKVLALTTLSAALMAVPAFAAEPAAADVTAKAKPAAKKPKSEMFEALSAIGAELKGVMGTGKGDWIPRLDKLAAHQYSDATREKISKVFGATEPFTIKRTEGSNGALNYLLSAPAFSYTDASATKFDWTELKLNMLLDKGGRNVSAQGSWPSFSVSDKTLSMTVSDMAYEATQHRNERDVWLGKGNFSIAKVSFATETPGAGAVLEGITVASAAVAHGTGVDFNIDSKVKALTVAGEAFDELRFAMRMTNFDMRLLEKVSENMSQAEREGKTPKQQLDAVAAQMKLLGKSAALRGSAIEISEISAGYHGNRAVIKGKITLAPGTDADYSSMDKFGKKLIVKVDVRVPVALVVDIAKLVMAKQAAAKKEAISEAALAQGAQSIADVMVGKLLNSGMGKLENGVLVSSILFKGGKLTMNGKEVTLPKTAKRPAQPVSGDKPADDKPADDGEQ